MTFNVRLKIMLMGRACRSCSQTFETTVQASSAEEAVAEAKAKSKADPDTHKFSILSIKEM